METTHIFKHGQLEIKGNLHWNVYHKDKRLNALYFHFYEDARNWALEFHKDLYDKPEFKLGQQPTFRTW